MYWYCYGENWCLSLLGLKNIVFYFKFILVIPNMTTGCCWTRVSILIWWLTFFAALVDQIIILTLFSWGHYITRHDIYNIIVLCTISWHAGSQKHQLWRAELILLQNRYKKQREKQKKKERERKKKSKEKRKERIFVVKSKARKTSLFNASRERSYYEF